MVTVLEPSVSRRHLSSKERHFPKTPRNLPFPTSFQLFSKTKKNSVCQHVVDNWKLHGLLLLHLMIFADRISS